MTNRMRRFWLNVHLWIGLVAGLLLVIIGLSGSLLVWPDELDALLNPERAVTNDVKPSLPMSAYVDGALSGLGPDVRPTLVLMPAEPREALRVTAILPAKQGRPRSFTAWLDPGDARLLDTADNRASTVGFLHGLHGSLMVPQWSGRQIVGWLGVIMSVSALTGIWLWWPRLGGYLKALWWRRARRTSANLHHVLGAWVALPLLVVSLTGVYISFPQAARALFSPAPSADAVRPAGPPAPAQPLQTLALDIDAVVAAALAFEPGARLTSLTFPTEAFPAWRALVTSSAGKTVSLKIDEPTGLASVSPVPERAAADPIARLMRRLHDGQDMGVVWQVFVFVSGVLPAILWVTGIMMWLRRRSPGRRRAQNAATVQRRVPVHRTASF